MSHHLLPCWCVFLPKLCCMGPRCLPSTAATSSMARAGEGDIADICFWKLPAPPCVASLSLLQPACCSLPAAGASYQLLLRLRQSHCGPSCCSPVFQN